MNYAQVQELIALIAWYGREKHEVGRASGRNATLQERQAAARAAQALRLIKAALVDHGVRSGDLSQQDAAQLIKEPA